MNSLKKLKLFLKKAANLTPFPVWYAYGGDLSSLRRKINFFLFFSPSQRRIFSGEKDFLNRNASISDHSSFLFPYPFVFNYTDKPAEVYTDPENGLFYVMHDGKRLYYSRKFSTETEVRNAYNGISMEQDENSPHCYMSDRFSVRENDTVVDIGAAEGNFSLDVIEKAGMVYIIEPDPDWIEALEATFRPWTDRVKIISKFVSDVDSGDNITLSGLLGESRVDFIKMDVGGAESRIISSSQELLDRNPAVRLAVCTYHREKDADTTVRVLTSLGFSCTFTGGYMLYVFSNLAPPYFRKTLIRAEKISGTSE